MLFWQRARWRLRRLLTLNRFRAVVLVGRYAGYKNEYPGKAQVWGANFAYVNDGKLDRLYTLDGRKAFEESGELDAFVKAVNGLGIPLYAQEAWPDIPESSAFPLGGVHRDVLAWDYYTSTIAYMLADAIREGYGTIVLYRLLVHHQSNEYIEQKACLDFWAGVAFGLGINVEISEDSQIARPYPWQSELYGYVTTECWRAGAKIMSDAMKDARRLPRVYRREK